MAYSCNWQEQGTRVGGKLLNEAEASNLIKIVRVHVQDPEILSEIEAFLEDEDPLSERTRDALQIMIVGIVMQWQDRQRY